MNGAPIYEETTVNGVTEQTLVGHHPAPKDVRRQVRTAMFRMAVGFTALALALSVAAIGHLFSAFVPWPVAYASAVVFDGLWVYALLGEWMSQTNEAARRAAFWSGLFFMAASMAAIILAGITLHELVPGIMASLVPLGVKGAWWLRLATTTHRLPVAYRNRLDKIRDQVHTELAVEFETRELDEARALTAELRQLRNAGADGTPEVAIPAAVPGSVTVERVPVPDPVPAAPAPVAAPPEPVPVILPVAPTVAPVTVTTASTGFGSNSTARTDLLKSLIADGVLGTQDLRDKLVEAGYAAPSAEYVRRVRNGVTKPKAP